jgi:DNA-binding transcriptional ArsR family regulator
MNAAFSQIAQLLSDPGRAAMIMALMDGTVLPAGQLAIIGNVAPQTASSHLAKLVRGKLLVAKDEGRHRYYRIANSDVAHAVEALLAIGLRASYERFGTRVRDERLVYARTCYSHLAGRVAVEIAEALQERRVLTAETRQFGITVRGHEWFRQLGIDLTAASLKQPGFARRCPDWTERRDHIAGKLGSALLNRFRELKWFVPLRNSRALRVTLEGQQKLRDLLRIQMAGESG